MTQFFPSAKDPEEIVTLSVDFTNLLEAAETIQSAVWLVELENGTAVDSASVLDGTVDISGAPVIRQKFKGGVDRTSYLHRAKATTSAGRVLVGGGLIQVTKGA